MTQIDIEKLRTNALDLARAGRPKSAILADEAADAIATLLSELERKTKALVNLVATYGDMEDGDGNPCPDVAFARAALKGEHHER